MKKKKVLKTVLIVILVLIVTIAGIGYKFIMDLAYPDAMVSGSGSKKVICIGDSITYGQGVLGSRETDTYPAILAELLGEEYQTVNYGLCNRTLLSTGNMPYVNEDFATESLAEDADIVIIMLGSNDSKPNNWNAELFEKEYLKFVQKYQNMDNAPTVYVMAPPCVLLETEDAGDCNDTILTEELIPIVKNIAEQTGVTLIDLHDLTEAHAEWFADGLHPNTEGNQAIAEEIFTHITAQ